MQGSMRNPQSGDACPPISEPTSSLSQNFLHDRGPTLLVSREMRRPKQAPTRAANTAVAGSDQPRLSRPLHTIAIPAVHHRSRLSNFMADHLRMIVERDLLHTLSAKDNRRLPLLLVSATRVTI